MRESFSTVAEEGAFIRRNVFADFFLNASTRRAADFSTRLANFGSRSARLYQLFVGLRNVVLVMADQEQISAGADVFDRGLSDRRR